MEGTPIKPRLVPVGVSFVAAGPLLLVEALYFFVTFFVALSLSHFGSFFRSVGVRGVQTRGWRALTQLRLADVHVQPLVWISSNAYRAKDRVEVGRAGGHVTRSRARSRDF